MLLETHLKQLKTSQPDKSLWKHLVMYHSHELPHWWDSERFDWENLSDSLCNHCARHFDIWFDEDKLNWKIASASLCIYCPEHFDKWWNPNRFDWYKGAIELLRIPDKVQVWMPELLNRPEILAKLFNELAECFPELFDTWWNPNLVDDLFYLDEAFFKNLPYRFRDWFNIDWVFLSTTTLTWLFDYCKDYIDIWLDPFLSKLKSVYGIDPDVVSLLELRAPEHKNKWLLYLKKSKKANQRKKLKLNHN